MREGGVLDDNGVVSDVEGVHCLGGREFLHSIRNGICVCIAVVLMALMVVVGVMVLMVVVGIVVLVIVVGVLCIGSVE